MSNLNTVAVTILGKEYQVSCPEDEVEELTRAARFLNSKMGEIRASGKVVGLDRIAVMAALNITHEMLNGQHSVAATENAINHRLQALSERVATTLAKHKQLEL